MRERERERERWEGAGRGGWTGRNQGVKTGRPGHSTPKTKQAMDDVKTDITEMPALNSQLGPGEEKM